MTLLKIQYLGDGLANQIRHYVFVRFAQRIDPKALWFFDDSFFFTRTVHNGYELEKVFGVKLNLLSRYFSKDVWDKIIQLKRAGIGLPQILLNMGLSTVMVAESCNHEPFCGEIINTYGFRPEVIKLPYSNIYYHGYWSQNDWFNTYKQENILELTFPKLIRSENLEYADVINGSLSVGIHVRRGGLVARGKDVPAFAYREACESVLDRYPNAHFFIFSDELDWCRVHKKELGFNLPTHTTYVAGNAGEQSYIDMQLLSMCKGIIWNGESSFAQVAGLLNNNLEFSIALRGFSSAAVQQRSI